MLFSFLTCLALLMGSSAWSAPPEAHHKERADRYGDPLPTGAVARMGSVLFYHGTPCTKLAFSPDGRILAVSGGGGNGFNIIAPSETHNCIRLLDTATGRQLRQLQGHSNTKYLRFSPDGKCLFSKGRDAGQLQVIKVWNVATGKVLHRLIGQTLSHDGQTLLVRVRGEDSVTIRFVNIATGKELRRISVPATMQFWFQLVSAPDDKTLAGDVGGSIYIWDAATGKVLHRLAGIKKVDVYWLAYSPT
ncbi:MAG: WD40 repeat domain-containing protein, partial [Gemmataceae bacterium]